MKITFNPFWSMQTNLEDPRCRPDFLPQFYPAANGKEAPPLSGAGQNDRIMLEFLATYYELNCAYYRLLEVRKEPPSTQRNEAERKCLQALEKVVILRDGLEDRYAPFGVIVAPTVQEGFTVNLKISFGNKDAAGRCRSELFTLTTVVPVPLPKGTKFEDLPLIFEGPGRSEY